MQLSDSRAHSFTLCQTEFQMIDLLQGTVHELLGQGLVIEVQSKVRIQQLARVEQQNIQQG